MEEQTLGARIAAHRKRLSLTQEALGEKLGVSRQAIYKWEQDAAVPEIDKLISLSRLFDVSLGSLLGLEESAQSEAETVSMTEPQLEALVQRLGLTDFAVKDVRLTHAPEEAEGLIGVPCYLYSVSFARMVNGVRTADAGKKKGMLSGMTAGFAVITALSALL